jgi:hypothetical protein
LHVDNSRPGRRPEKVRKHPAGAPDTGRQRRFVLEWSEPAKTATPMARELRDNLVGAAAWAALDPATVRRPCDS